MPHNPSQKWGCSRLLAAAHKSCLEEEPQVLSACAPPPLLPPSLLPNPAWLLPTPPTHLKQVEAHVVAKDVEWGPRGAPAFHVPRLEEPGVAELVAGWQGKPQQSGVPKAVQDVDEGAAGGLVGLQEDQVLPWLAGEEVADRLFLPQPQRFCRGDWSVRGGEQRR